MEKIDIHDTDNNLKKSLIKLEKDVSKNNYNLIKNFLDDSAIGKTARKNAGRKQVGNRARLKNMYLLKVATKFFNKDLDKINISDMERLIGALNNDILKKENGKKYSEQTKANIKRALIIFLRWVLKDNKKYHDLTDWIETRFKRKEFPALSEKDIETIISKCNTIKQKFLIAFLFDSGVRIEEFLNIRLGDITEVEGDVKYYKATVRNEFSKTTGRTIGLFWKNTTSLLKEWLELHPNKGELDAQLYPSTYDGVRSLLYKLGIRSLHKKINPHLFRHSSATYYASRINRQLLCKRYGWSFSSNMPDRYIDRAGVEEESIANEFKQGKFEEVSVQNKELQEQISILKEEMKELVLEVHKGKNELKNKDDEIWQNWQEDVNKKLANAKDISKKSKTKSKRR